MFRRGAEAIIKKSMLIGRKVVIKERMAKTYRIQKLDEHLRIERTRLEARLLHRAKLAGVNCPVVLEVDGFSLILTYINGNRPEMTPNQSFEAGHILILLHKNNIIHGDFTPANLLLSKTSKGPSLHVIDFGLGFISLDIEDKAMDVFTMLRALREKKEKEAEAFLKGYSSSYEFASYVLKRLAQIEKRVRYAF